MLDVPYTPPVLKLGDRNDRVYAIKRALLKAGRISHIGPFPKLYGPRVAEAVRNLQLDHAITPDGRVGKFTIEALAPFVDEYGYFLYTGKHPGLPPLQLPAVFKPTHDTSGLPGFPAIDCFAPPGSDVLAPADVKLVWPHFISWDRNAHVGGWTCYLQSENGWFFDTHFGTVRERGLYRKGDKIGTVGKVPNGWWESHIHHGWHQGSFTPSQL